MLAICQLALGAARVGTVNPAIQLAVELIPNSFERGYPMLSDPLTQQDRCFFDLLEQRAQAHPERSAYIALTTDGTESAHVTYGELHRKVESYAMSLTARGLSGARALMLFEPGLAFVIAFLGCLRAKVVAIPANIAKPGRTSWDRLVAIARDSGAVCILTEPASASKISGWFATNPELRALDILCFNDNQEDRQEKKSVISHERPQPDTPAFLQYTSGATGDPKGTVITFSNLAHNAVITGQATGIDFDARVVTWLPLYHDLGLIGNVLQTLWAGAQCVLMPPVAFAQNPARWLEAIDRYRATVSMAPNFAYELCVRRIPPERRSQFDLSSWKVAFNAAEPIRAATIHRFAQIYKNNGFEARSIQTAYGLAEATLVVTSGDTQAPTTTLAVDSAALEQGKLIPATDPNSKNNREIVSSGFVRQNVRIVNPKTLKPCAAHEIGEIWVSGPCVASGYWGRDEETRQIFRARTADGEGPFLRSGDLGVLYDNQLYMTGRIKEVIIVHGRNIYPQDIETTTQHAHEALRVAGCAAFTMNPDGGNEGESIVIVQEVERSMLATIDREEVVSAISEAVFREHNVAIAEVVLVKPEVLPKTSSGKIQRALCRKLYARNELDRVVQGRLSRANPLLGSAVQTRIKDVKEIVAPAQQIQALDPHTPLSVDSIVALIEAWLVTNGLKTPVESTQTFAELGLDSMNVIELATFLQQQLTIEVDHTVVYDYPTLDMLARFLFSICGRNTQTQRVSAEAMDVEANFGGSGVLGVVGW